MRRCRAPQKFMCMHSAAFALQAGSSDLAVGIFEAPQNRFHVSSSSLEQSNQHLLILDGNGRKQL